MGSLNPGATYVYERANGVIYSRESGADPSTRRVVGYENANEYDPVSGHRIDYDKRTSDGRPLHDHIMDAKMWGEIRRAAPSNPALQDALDRVIMIYQLTKNNER